jgi:hypothetical protein
MMRSSHNVLIGIAVALATVGVARSVAAQNIQVTAANPNTGAQGTTALVVKISGRNFAPGAKTDFFLSGTTNPAGITVHGTQWINASEVDATIDIADTASIAQFDIKVTNTATGRSGKGSDMFSVIQKGTSACSLEPLDPQLGLEQEFNPSALYQGLGPSSLIGRATVSAAGEPANTVLVVALGTNNTYSKIEIFFVDPTSGALLDGQPLCVGCAAQPHVTLNVPLTPDGGAGGAKFSAIGNINGDGVPDFATAENNGANIFVSTISSSGVVGWTPLPAPRPAGVSNFGWDVALGDIDGDGLDELAVSQVGSGSGKAAQGGAVYLYDYSGAGLSLIDTITEATVSPSIKSGELFGSSVALGDVTGDPRADVVVGVSSRTVNGLTGAGAVFVLETTASGISRTAKVLTSSVPAKDASFGAEVVAAKLESSGRAAVIASTHWNSYATTDGEVFPSPVTNGQVGSLRFTPRSGFETGWATRKFAVGDVNGDGLADIVVGAPNAGNGGNCNSPGMVYLFLRTTDSGGQPAGWSRVDWQGPVAGWFGWSVAAVDGAPFVVVGQTIGNQAYLYRVLP